MYFLLLEMAIVLAEWGMLVYTFTEPWRRFLLSATPGNGAAFGLGLLLFWI